MVNDLAMGAVSECCGAPTDPDIPICSECLEWCEYEYE